MTKSDKIILRGGLAIIFVIALGLCALALLGCSDSGDDRRTILPVVTVPAPPDRFVTCHDWDGVSPDREFQRAKVDAVGRSKSPRFCFIGDVCFYGCPRN